MYHPEQLTARVRTAACTLFIPSLMFLLTLAAALPVAAQRGAPAEPPEFEEAKGPAIERKTPSFFRRPVESTPEAQWQRVQRLEAEKETKRAIRAANALVRTWHHTAEAALAQLAIARLYEARDNTDAAFNEYQYLIDHFAGLFPFQQVLERQYQIANHMLAPPKSFLGLQLNSMEETRLRFEQIAQNAPNWERTPDALLKAASCHELEGDPFAAADAYSRLQTRYPSAAATLAASAEEIRIRRELAAKYPMDEALTHRAVAAIDNALRAHGGRMNRDELMNWRAELNDAAMNRAFERASFYDVKRKQPRAALTAYREFVRTYPNSPHAEAVRVRISELENASEAAVKPSQLGEKP